MCAATAGDGSSALIARPFQECENQVILAHIEGGVHAGEARTAKENAVAEAATAL